MPVTPKRAEMKENSAMKKGMIVETVEKMQKGVSLGPAHEHAITYVFLHLYMHVPANP